MYIPASSVTIPVHIVEGEDAFLVDIKLGSD